MRKFFLVGAASLLLMGCVATSLAPSSEQSSQESNKSLIPIGQVRIGMTTSEVAGILGKDFDKSSGSEAG